MSDTLDIARQAPAPAADLQALGRLVGTWRVRGIAEGTVSYEWLEGGFFLLQRVDLSRNGERIRGIEIIGHQQPFDAGPRDEIRSRYYDNAGNTLEHVYSLHGDTLTVWVGERGSPAHYRGVFSTDGSTLTGRWVYAGTRGQDITAVRATYRRRG